METKFQITVSTSCYSSKDSIQKSRLILKQKEIDINSFIELIKKGYTFCHIFKDKTIATFNKTKENYRATQAMFFDIDNSSMTMEECIEKLTLKPTIGYTTLSNDYSNKIYRYRLVYVFDSLIKGVDNYIMINELLTDSIINDTNIELDKCSKSYNQQYFGSNKNCCILNSNIIYNVNDIFAFLNNNTYYVRNAKNNDSSSDCFNNDSSDNLVNINSINIDNSKERSDAKRSAEGQTLVVRNSNFMVDYNLYEYALLLKRYEREYEIITASKIEFNKMGYGFTDENYMELHRSYQKVNSIITGDGMYIPKVYKHGDNRSKHLFNVGMIKKTIKPDTTIDEILYNLIHEFVYYIDNSDNRFNKSNLIEIAKNVMNRKSSIVPTGKRPRFKVDENYCKMMGISKRTRRNQVTKILNNEEIAKYYDVTKSVKENLVILNENGVNVSQRKLYNYCKEFNINTKGEKKKNDNNKINITCQPSNEEMVEIGIRMQIRPMIEELKNAELEANTVDSKAISSDLIDDNEVTDNNITNEETTPKMTLKEEIEAYSKTNTLYSTFTYYFQHLSTDSELNELKEWVNESDSNCKGLWLIMLDSRIGSESQSMAYAS